MAITDRRGGIICASHKIILAIAIKLPEGVPPALEASFTSLIPYEVVFMTARIIRAFLGFDFATWLTTLIAPSFNAADNVFVYTVTQFMQNLFWATWIHGDSMFGRNNLVVCMVGLLRYGHSSSLCFSRKFLDTKRYSGQRFQQGSLQLLSLLCLAYH